MFPAVITRRLDCEPRADSPWHELGRALHSRHVEVDLPFGARIELQEFGEPSILVEGAAMPRPRIGKSYELLAFLLSRKIPAASRDELLTALFGGRSDSSARSYLRQAVHHLREVLPDEVRLESNPARVSLERSVSLSSESARLEALLAPAGRLQGQERLEATLRAIALSQHGEYLEGLSSRWIEERRERLNRLIIEAHYEAAELAFAVGATTMLPASSKRCSPAIRSAKARTVSRCALPTRSATRTG